MHTILALTSEDTNRPGDASHQKQSLNDHAIYKTTLVRYIFFVRHNQKFSFVVFTESFNPKSAKQTI